MLPETAHCSCLMGSTTEEHTNDILSTLIVLILLFIQQKQDKDILCPFYDNDLNFLFAVKHRTRIKFSFIFVQMLSKAAMVFEVSI